MIGDPYIICHLSPRTRQTIIRRMTEIFDEFAEVTERNDNNLSPISQQLNLAGGDEIQLQLPCNRFDSDSE